MSPEEIKNKFYRYFDFSYDNFSNPIQWVNGIGFSRVKKYGNGYASLYKFGILDPELSKKDNRKNLYISVSYGKEVGGGIQYSENRITDPIELSFSDEFFFDIDSNIFYDRTGKSVNPIEILKRIEEGHTRPTRTTPRALWLRIRLWFWRIFLPYLIKRIDLFIISLLWIISGERIKDDILRRLLGIKFEKFNEPAHPVKPQYEESKTMQFFGYQAKRWSVVFYCFFNLIIFSVFFCFQIKSGWLNTVLKNNFLALCFVVVTFVFTEALIPDST